MHRRRANVTVLMCNLHGILHSGLCTSVHILYYIRMRKQIDAWHAYAARYKRTRAKTVVVVVVARLSERFEGNGLSRARSCVCACGMLCPCLFTSILFKTIHIRTFYNRLNKVAPCDGATTVFRWLCPAVCARVLPACERSCVCER